MRRYLDQEASSEDNGMMPDRQELFAGSGKNLGSEEGTAPDFWVRFFGGFEVFCRGEPLELGRNGKALAIFKRLLTRGGRPISQDVLVDWLWPKSSLQKARWSLNSAVYTLRKSLDEQSPDGASFDCVVLERGHYRLAWGLRISSDVEDFDAGYERGHFLGRAESADDAASEYEKVVTLYRGDYLVEDLYEDWTMIERERLTSAYVDLLDRLAAYHAQAGNFQRCITDRYLLLEKDSYHEESYRSLMRCYARLGLRGRALSQYELCGRRLDLLCGIQPAPETKNLYESLVSGDDL